MNDAFFIGVYPGLTTEMLDYVEEVFADFFQSVLRRQAAVSVTARRKVRK